MKALFEKFEPGYDNFLKFDRFVIDDEYLSFYLGFIDVEYELREWTLDQIYEGVVF